METFDDEDLVSFINKEKQSLDNLNIYRAYRHFSKCLNKGACEIYSRFQFINDINIPAAIIYGTNMIYYVFWILLSYSYNTKLTIFLTERAVLLFIEFIIMSRSDSNNNSTFAPSIKDAINFAYKKTIGIIIPNFNDNDELKAAKNAAYDITYILQEIFLKIIYPKDNLDEKVQLNIRSIVPDNPNILFNSDKSINNIIIDSNDEKFDKINLHNLYKHIKDDLAIFSNNDNPASNLKIHFVKIDNMIYFISNTLYDFYTIFKMEEGNYAYNKIVTIFKLNNDDDYTIKDIVFICKILFESFFDVYERTGNYEKTKVISDKTYRHFIDNKIYSPKLENEYNINKKKGNYFKFRKLAFKLIN